MKRLLMLAIFVLSFIASANATCCYVYYSLTVTTDTGKLTYISNVVEITFEGEPIPQGLRDARVLARAEFENNGCLDNIRSRVSLLDYTFDTAKETEEARQLNLNNKDIVTKKVKFNYIEVDGDCLVNKKGRCAKRIY